MASTKVTLDEFPIPSQEDIQAAVSQFLKGADFDSLKWVSEDGLSLDPYYRKHDKKFEERNRFLSTLMPCSWLVRQNVGGASAEAINKELSTAVGSGVNGLGIDLDAIDGRSYDTIFKNIFLEHVELTVRCSDLNVLIRFLEWIESSGNKLGSYRIESDPFANHSGDDHLDEILKISMLTGARGTFHADGVSRRNAGATLVQETAFALATGSEYLAILGAEQVDKIHFSLGVGSSYFLEIARLRAFRVLWQNVLSAFDTQGTAYIHCAPVQTNLSTLDEENNIIRLSAEAMAAVIGGCDCLSVGAYNYLSQKHDSAGMRYGRNIQLILKEESYMEKIRDAAAGSHYLEALTDEILKASWTLFQEIESKGGMNECVKSGFIDQLISISRKETQTRFDEGKQTLVGVNLHRNKSEQAASAKIAENENEFRVARSLEDSLSENIGANPE